MSPKYHGSLLPGSRSSIISIILLFSIGCTLGNNAEPYRPPADYHLPLHQYQLDNGLQVIVIPNRSMPIIQIGIVVRAGSIVETPSTNGLAHFVEHLVARRGLAENDDEDLFYQLREHGVVYNALTSNDYVRYYYDVHRDNVYDILPLVAQSIIDPKFGSQQVEDERGAILAEMDLRNSDPVSLAYDKRTRLLFSDYPEKKIVLGEREVIENATSSELKGFHSQWYVPSNSVVVISGDIDADEARQLVEENFEQWTEKENPFDSHPVPEFKPLSKDNVSVLHGQVNGTTLIMTWLGPDTRNDRHGSVVGDVLEMITGQGSNVFRYLVDEGYAISAGLGYEKKRDSSIIEAVLKIPRGNEEDTILYLMSILKKLANPEHQSQDELAAAKDEIWMSWVDKLDEATLAGSRVSTTWGIADIDYFVEYIDTVYDVQNTDIRKFLKNMY